MKMITDVRVHEVDVLVYRLALDSRLSRFSQVDLYLPAIKPASISYGRRAAYNLAALVSASVSVRYVKPSVPQSSLAG